VPKENNPTEVLEAASPEVQRVIRRVIQQEYQLLHMKKPYGINDEIEKIIREEVK